MVSPLGGQRKKRSILAGGSREGLMEQVACKLDLEGWVGFQQADVRVGRGEEEAAA